MTYGQRQKAGQYSQLIGNSDATLCWLQKEEYAQVLASLETAPAQDVIVLMLYLVSEMWSAVHLGVPVIYTVSQAVYVSRNAVAPALKGDIVLPACITYGGACRPRMRGC